MIERKTDMLNISNLTKRYGKVTACEGINLDIADGEVAILLGPNGAGKSTLLKSVTGLLKYDGAIFIKDYHNKTPEARRIMGYIPEMPALYPNLTVSEHMEFIARAYRLENYRERADRLIDAFELTDKKKKFGDELSKGMQQKLNICLGLLPDPEFVIMDEPMIGLDPHAIKQLKLIIEEMRQRGRTVLISTHIIDSVDMLWDRTIIMQGGVIRADITKARLDAAGKTLEEFFFAVTEGVSIEDVRQSSEVFGG